MTDHGLNEVKNHMGDFIPSQLLDDILDNIHRKLNACVAEADRKMTRNFKSGLTVGIMGG